MPNKDRSWKSFDRLLGSMAGGEAPSAGKKASAPKASDAGGRGTASAVEQARKREILVRDERGDHIGKE